MRAYPRQIEADLQKVYPGRRIREWYHTLATGDLDRGMSSRELFVLVMELPDNSRFKRAVGPGWTDLELILARLSNDFRAANTSPEDDIVDPLRPPNMRGDSDGEPDESDEVDDGQLRSIDISRYVHGDLSVVET